MRIARACPRSTVGPNSNQKEESGKNVLDASMNTRTEMYIQSEKSRCSTSYGVEKPSAGVPTASCATSTRYITLLQRINAG